MPILNIKTESIGASGQIPKMIYINTSDTVSGVQADGYLNSVVNSFNIPLSETDLAMVVTRPTPTSSDALVGLYNIIFDNDNWSLEAFVGGAVSGADNVGVGAEIFAGQSGSVLSFKTIIAGNNVFITDGVDHITIESVTGGFAPGDDYVITGHFSFLGGFDVNSPDPVTISSNGQLLLQSTGDVARLLGNTIDIIAIVGDANYRSDNGNINLFCNNGHLNLSGQTGTLSSGRQLDIFSGSGYNLSMNTSNGNFNVFAGTGPSPGQMNLGARDTVNINSQTDVINLNANGSSGSVNLSGGNATNGSWSAGSTGVGGGVSAGSGCTFDAVTGNVSFGASTGAFLLGALANSVDVLAGTIMTLTAATKLDLACSNVVCSLITSQAPVVAAPTISLPVGFKYVVIDDTTGQLYKMG